MGAYRSRGPKDGFNVVPCLFLIHFSNLEKVQFASQHFSSLSSSVSTHNITRDGPLVKCIIPITYTHVARMGKSDLTGKGDKRADTQVCPYARGPILCMYGRTCVSALLLTLSLSVRAHLRKQFSRPRPLPPLVPGRASGQSFQWQSCTRSPHLRGSSWNRAPPQGLAWP